MKAAAPSLAALLVLFTCLSAVYLLFLPHALPCGDDWMVLQMFHHERSAGPLHALAFVRYMVDNTWWVQFRFFWVSWIPIYVVSFFADFAGWPYFLLGWTAHLLTAVLLCRLVSLLAGETWTGFAAATVFSAFPIANHVLFTPLPIYFFALLSLTLWFYLTQKKLAVSESFRYGWKDLALVFPALFTGEQNLLLVVLLPPLTFWLWGRRERRRVFLRYWAAHVAVMAAVLSFYVVCVNRVPILQTVHSRFAAGAPWSLRPPETYLAASIGLFPELAGWRPRWRVDTAWVVLLLLVGFACYGGFRWSAGERAGSNGGKLLLWSAAGAILSYLPVARLTTFELRYLYVPCAFLIVAGVVVLSLAGRRVASALILLFIGYCVSYTYFEMRQCWIPQAIAGRAVLEAAKKAAPVAPGEILIFSGEPRGRGFAPRFATGSSWAIGGMLEHYARPYSDFKAGTDLVINERSDLGIHTSDVIRWLHRQDLRRMRVFVREENDRWVAKSIVALPAAGRYELVAIPPFPGRPLPAEAMTIEELRRLPIFGEIYFARRIDAATKAWEI